MVKKKKKYDSKFWMSLFLLALMVLSIAGFAMIYSSNIGSSRHSNSNMALKYYDQYGVWATIKNNQEFVFKDINQYENMKDLDNLANRIKSVKNINVFVDNNFDPSSQLIIEKALDALNIKHSQISNFVCNPSTLILTNNKSISGNCMIFYSKYNETYNKANGLVYYLVK